MESSELIKLAILMQVDRRSTLRRQDLRSDEKFVETGKGMFLFVVIVLFLYKGVLALSIFVIIVDTLKPVSYL